MIKSISLVIALFFAGSSWAREPITIYFNTAVTASNYASYLKAVAIANKNQNKYQFQIEVKAGANGLLAVRAMDEKPESSLATAAASFVENARAGLINEKDYVAVAAQGDACWGVISTVGNTSQGISSLQGRKDMSVGTTGPGNVTHLTVLTLGEKYGFSVRFVGFKSSRDAVLTMVAGESLDIAMDSIKSYTAFKERNPRLQLLGVSCPRRHPLAPEIKTLAEQGFNMPSVFLVTLANIKMPEQKRREIESIMEQAQAELGSEFLFETADLYPPQFDKPKRSAQQYFEQKVAQVKSLQNRFRQQIELAK